MGTFLNFLMYFALAIKKFKNVPDLKLSGGCDQGALACRLDLFLHASDPVFGVDVDEGGLEAGELLLVIGGVVGDDDEVPPAHLPGSRAVQADDPRVPLPLDDISGKPVPVVDVVDVDLLVL